MSELMIVTKSPGAWAAFAAALAAESGVNLSWAKGRDEALTRLKQGPVSLAVVDGDGGDDASLALLQDMTEVSAMTNTAVVSTLSEAEFHEFYEGLGVLERLPPKPGRAQALDLAAKLAALTP